MDERLTPHKTVRGTSADRDKTFEIDYDEQMIRAVRESAASPGEHVPVITAGLIDLQVNGFAGLDINSSGITPETVVELTAKLAALGVTTWVPTIITATEGSITHALEQIAKARALDTVTHAAIPSVHIEGPFISDRDGPRGVHDARQVRPIDAAEAARWQRHGNLVGLVTVSPHAVDAVAQITKMRALGIHVAVGHTHASPEQVTAAIDAGARVATHLGNGVSLTLPRHPNIIWTQLADDRITTGMIADGHHLPMQTVEVMLRAKTVRRAFLVSDSTALAGMPTGTYPTPVGGEVELSTSGRLSSMQTGLLAGAAAALPQGLSNVVAGTTFSLTQALRLVTSTPAGILRGARPGLGHLRPGAPADLVLLEESNSSHDESSSGLDESCSVTVVGAIQSGRTVLASAGEK